MVDHTHITLAALQALGPDEQPTRLAERLDYQIEHILVDEFQDTSASQAMLLERITRGWYEHNEGAAYPRTLFLVGDAMKSIYGFILSVISSTIEELSSIRSFSDTYCKCHGYLNSYCPLATKPASSFGEI